MSDFNPARRALFKRLASMSGKADSPFAFRRPPMSLPEVEFLQACDQCGQCVQQCPANGILMEQGYPAIPEPVTCQECYTCVLTCPTGALQASKLRIEVSQACDPDLASYCADCAKACPQSAIEIPVRQSAQLDQSRCVQCGDCTNSCEFGAIKVVAA